MAGIDLDLQQAITSPEAAWKRVAADAEAIYGDQAPDPAWIEAKARQAVEELWTDDLRIRAFVPVLAMRRVRELVDRELARH
jgi:hypothetical protein